MFNYREIRMNFDEIEISDDTIEFKTNSEIILMLDAGTAIEEKESSEISTRFLKKNFRFGNKSNHQKIFKDIAEYYNG